MTKSKKSLALFFAFIMIISNMFAITVPVSAATTNWGTTSERTIYVTTADDNKWWAPYIILKQSKGVYEWEERKTPFSSKVKLKEKECYGKWYVEFESTDGEHDCGFFAETFDGKEIKIKLKPGKEYRITVRWAKGAPISTDNGEWTTIPTWTVSKTHRISDYR